MVIWVESIARRGVSPILDQRRPQPLDLGLKLTDTLVTL
jgi:hypothetical protein